MSKLSLMIFTLVILTTILCSHSVFSRQRPQKMPCACKGYKDNFKHVEKRSPPKGDVVCVCRRHHPCECRDSENSVHLYNDYIEFMRKRFPKGNVQCVWKKKCKGVKRSNGSRYNAPTPL